MNVARSATLLRIVAILTGGLVALWIAVGVTANFTIGGEIPALVRPIWPVGITAKVTEGRQLLVANPAPSSATIDRARHALRDAAVREPINTLALGTLAALDELRGDHDRARSLFKLSETVSRRNQLTELWLIEDAVARGNIVEAIAHYDRAMRVAIDLRPTLLPVLNNAASNPDVLKALVPVLRQRPLWWKDYLQLLGTSGSDPQVMATVLYSVRPNIGQGDERVLLENVLRRMVAIKGDREAARVANALEGIKDTTRSLRGGDFNSPGGVLPFAWWLRDEANIRAYRDIVPNGTMGLRVEASDDTTGGVAQQLVGLPAGDYILSGVVGDVPADPVTRPAITVTCSDNRPITRFVLPPAPQNGAPFRFRFTIPGAKCATQWVNILTASVGDTNVWFDTMTLSPFQR